MSLNKTQIDALIDRNCKSSDISYPVEEKTADENIALDAIYALIFSKGGTWQFDDSNHEKYPIITTDLVSGQRDYTFVEDQQGNLILDIYKVMVKGPDGVFREMKTRDQQSLDQANNEVTGFVDGQAKSGTPTRVDKTANGIFLDEIPNYNSEGGLKVFINREGSYFIDSDTTKKPGFSGLFHAYIAIHCSVAYCKRNMMFDLAATYQNDLIKMEQDISDHYGKRERDIPRRMMPRVENTR